MILPSSATGGFFSKFNDRQRKWRVFDVITADQPRPLFASVKMFQESSIDCDSFIVWAQVRSEKSIFSSGLQPQIFLGWRNITPQLATIASPRVYCPSANREIIFCV